MFSVRPLRLALLSLVVLLAVPAAAVKAAPRMPIGFFDDPSFRWANASAITANLAAAKKANATIIHVLADWRQIAPEKPANPLNGNDPAYNLSDLDALVANAPRYNQQVFITITGAPGWANGNRTPNHPPKRLSDLTNFAQMLAGRYNGKRGYGFVTRWAVWNEPNLGLFLTPQFNSAGKIVSGRTYAKLYMAAYKGIKKGNPRAIVVAGETSNRGRNKPSGGAISDSVAPATFAHMVSLANPKLPFAAWSTHPYPTQYRFGPTQKVSYPNVGLTNISKLGDSLRQWFHRRVPIWITEWGEQTRPECSTNRCAVGGGVSWAQQAKDARTALKLAAANPYVEMFIWFIFRDSTNKTWFSGLKTATGRNKPSYRAFSSTSKSITGQTQVINPRARSFTVKVDAPFLAYHDLPGTIVGVTYDVYQGKFVAALGQPRSVIAADGTVSFKVKFRPAKGAFYTMKVDINDKHGQHQTVMIALPTS